MNAEKEKSAVGMAVPATERKNINIDPDIIISCVSEKSKTIKVVIQRPGELSVVARIAQSIEELNALVGGMSTAVTIPDNGLKLIMNVNSKRRRKPTLKTLWGRIYGTVLIMAADGDTFIDLTPDQVQSARGWLLRHTYEEVAE
ncbi:MAG: hypothetical protein IIW48_08400 [Clostridia bacterium]|nr:hypothetical protein [Clostridia bacterium]